MPDPIDLSAALKAATAAAALVHPPTPHPETPGDVFRKVEEHWRHTSAKTWYRRQQAAHDGLEWCDVCEEPGERAEMHDCGLHHADCRVDCDRCGDALPLCEMRDRCGCCDRRVCRECSCGCSRAKGCDL